MGNETMRKVLFFTSKKTPFLTEEDLKDENLVRFKYQRGLLEAFQKKTSDKNIEVEIADFDQLMEKFAKQNPVLAEYIKKPYAIQTNDANKNLDGGEIFSLARYNAKKGANNTKLRENLEELKNIEQEIENLKSFPARLSKKQEQEQKLKEKLLEIRKNLLSKEELQKDITDLENEIIENYETAFEKLKEFLIEELGIENVSAFIAGGNDKNTVDNCRDTNPNRQQ